MREFSANDPDDNLFSVLRAILRFRLRMTKYVICDAKKGVYELKFVHAFSLFMFLKDLCGLFRQCGNFQHIRADLPAEFRRAVHNQVTLFHGFEHIICA